MTRPALEHLGWRGRPGIPGRHASSPQSVHALLGYFLRELYRPSVAVIEPWPNVGTNQRGGTVRASGNIAYVLQQVADAERLANVLGAGIATIVQGGNPSVHDASSFDGSRANLEDILGLVDQLLLRRSTGSGPTIFICLGHPLAAASHLRLIRRATRELLELARLPMDPGGRALPVLQRLCRKIGSVGETLRVMKRSASRNQELKEHDGVRLLVRLLYHGMQE